MRRPAAALLLLASAAASGCAASVEGPAASGSSSPAVTSAADQAAAETSPSTRPAPGAVTAADGSFSAVPPSGWSVQTAQRPGSSLYLRGSTVRDDLVPTFGVIRSALDPRRPPALEDLVGQGTIAQRQKGATVSKVADRTIGGLPASGYTLTRTQDGHPVTQVQYYVVHADQVFVTTWTSATGDPSAAGAQEAILSTWAWGTAPATGPGTPSAPAVTTPAPAGTTPAVPAPAR